MGRPKIYSPMERQAARKIRRNRNSKLWQSRHPEKVEAYRRYRWSKDRDKMLAQNREWQKRHPDYKSKMGKRAVRELRPFYIRNLLRGHGILNPSPEQIEAQRRRVITWRRKLAALRSRPVLSIVSACASLTKKSPTF